VQRPPKVPSRRKRPWHISTGDVGGTAILIPRSNRRRNSIVRVNHWLVSRRPLKSPWSRQRFVAPDAPERVKCSCRQHVRTSGGRIAGLGLRLCSGKAERPRARSAVPASSDHHPPRGTVASFVYGRKAQAKTRALFGQRYFTCCNSYKHSRLFRLVLTARRSPTDNVAPRQFYLAKAPEPVPGLDPIILRLRHENSPLEHRRHSPLTARITC
jgi:hypothetical protein